MKNECDDEEYEIYVASRDQPHCDPSFFIGANCWMHHLNVIQWLASVPFFFKFIQQSRRSTQSVRLNPCQCHWTQYAWWCVSIIKMQLKFYIKNDYSENINDGHLISVIKGAGMCSACCIYYIQMLYVYIALLGCCYNISVFVDQFKCLAGPTIHTFILFSFLFSFFGCFRISSSVTIIIVVCWPQPLPSFVQRLFGIPSHRNIFLLSVMEQFFRSAILQLGNG